MSGQNSLEDKQNPEKRAEFREKLAKYLAIQRQARFYADMEWDETGFSHSTQEWGKR